MVAVLAANSVRLAVINTASALSNSQGLAQSARCAGPAFKKVAMSLVSPKRAMEARVKAEQEGCNGAQATKAALVGSLHPGLQLALKANKARTAAPSSDAPPSEPGQTAAKPGDEQPQSQGSNTDRHQTFKTGVKITGRLAVAGLNAVYDARGVVQPQQG